MKNKEFKPCADKDCDNDFKLFLSTQKYCSASCAYKNKKPINTKVIASFYARKPINKKSKKQASLDRTYSVLRKIFLNRNENKYCPVAYYFLKQDNISTEDYIKWRENIKAIEIHHKAGRVGKLYLYVPFWLAVSRDGHDWIHANPKEAYKKGWLIKSTTV